MKRFLALLHRTLARAGPVARGYLEVLSVLCRMLGRQTISTRVSNNISQTAWPRLDFAPRAVTVGREISVLLHPHIGEFDQEALFSRKMSYEAQSFRWLEAHCTSSYDAVVEIGANVGLFTLFFDRLARKPGSHLSSVYAFEPSREAYRRLLLNLHANRAEHVFTFNAAVTAKGGLVRFYEPNGHLTNGSIIRDFSALFSDDVSEHLAIGIAARDLEPLFAAHRKVLLKIDVEGYEPTLLSSLTPIVSTYKPDILIEVLPYTVEAIEAVPCIKDYEPSLVAETVEPSNRLYPHPRFRDWLLTSRPAAVDREPASPSQPRAFGPA